MESLIIIAAIVILLTAIYRLLPFREPPSKKPRLALFPKYKATFNCPLEALINHLEEIGFSKAKENRYNRGKIYGDFSISYIKLWVEIDPDSKQLFLYAPFLGVLFDTGDLWSLMSEATSY